MYFLLIEWKFNYADDKFDLTLALFDLNSSHQVLDVVDRFA